MNPERRLHTRNLQSKSSQSLNTGGHTRPSYRLADHRVMNKDNPLKRNGN
jgi:hypothetical protein